MMPIGPLMIEHRLIERMVDLLKKEFHTISETQVIDTSFIEEAIDFFKVYADRCHHGKEEDILFRDLSKKDLSPEHKVMMDELNAFEGVRAYKPDGTFYCFADFSNYEKNSTKLAFHLLEKVRVIVVPGVEFGMEGFLRLSTCGTIKDITQGIERMKWAIDPNSPNELFIGQRKLVRDWI